MSTSGVTAKSQPHENIISYYIVEPNIHRNHDEISRNNKLLHTSIYIYFPHTNTAYKNYKPLEVRPNMTRLTKITIVIMSLVSVSAMGDLPSCETILETLSPCAKQQNNDVKPPQTCCDAIQSLSRYSNDKEDRHEICDCIKAS